MMLEIESVRKSFGSLEVLRGVSLSVEPGDVVAILGPSGSGKTTLLRCINFLEKADEGQMTIGDMSVDFKTVKKKEIRAIREKSGFVFQNYCLFNNKTALENVMIGLTVGRKVPKEQARETAMKMLDRVGLSERYDFYPSQLSGGQQQRVAIARALAAKPAILLADEPTGNLDSRTSQDVMSLLKVTGVRFAQTIVMITHNEEIAQMADRIVRIEDGRIAERRG